MGALIVVGRDSEGCGVEEERSDISDSSERAEFIVYLTVKQGELILLPHPSLSTPSPDTYITPSFSPSLSPYSTPHISLSYPLISANVLSYSFGVIVFPQASPAIASSQDMNEGNCSGWR